MQETDLRLRRLDELMESLVEGELVNLLNRRDLAVDHTTTSARKNYGERRWEFDVLAVNGGEVVVVEVKTTLKVADVDYFVERLHEFPELMPEYADRRVYGAGGLPQVARVGDRARRTPGSVRDPRHRQQRQHHQRRRLHAAYLRSAHSGGRRRRRPLS